jgi:tripartite-type tricarboxylate transporter receptor subunit TctC
MPKLTRRAVLAQALGTGAAALLLTGGATAQADYPNRPIRLVVPFPPGGVNDAVARPWAEAMRTRLGTVAVENIGGGGSTIGTAQVSKAKPDGYTLLLGGAAGLVVNPAANPNVTYDPVKDLDPVTLLALAGLALTVHPSVPAKTLQELTAHVKANQGTMFYASSGVGTAVHLAGELYKQLIAAPALGHVPYRGAAPATTDLLAGQVQMSFVNITGQVLEFHRTGKLRIIATTNPQRLASAPDIPTAIESGLPGLVAQNFTGIWAPAGTSKAIADKIASATNAALADAEFRKIVVTAGLEPVERSSPDQARQYLAQETAKWGPLIRSIGLQIG